MYIYIFYFHQLTILAIFPFHPHVCPNIDHKVLTPLHGHCAMIVSDKLEGGDGWGLGERVKRDLGRLLRAC